MPMLLKQKREDTSLRASKERGSGATGPPVNFKDETYIHRTIAPVYKHEGQKSGAKRHSRRDENSTIGRHESCKSLYERK